MNLKKTIGIFIFFISITFALKVNPLLKDKDIEDIVLHSKSLFAKEA